MVVVASAHGMRHLSHRRALQACPDRSVAATAIQRSVTWRGTWPGMEDCCDPA